jgi:hypothetical protein
MQKFDEFEDLTQFDPETKSFRRMYAGCKTCMSIAQMRLDAERISILNASVNGSFLCDYQDCDDIQS